MERCKESLDIFDDYLGRVSMLASRMEILSKVLMNDYLDFNQSTLKNDISIQTQYINNFEKVYAIMESIEETASETVKAACDATSKYFIYSGGQKNGI